MREILFRGKRVDTGKWIYGSYLHQTDFYGDKVDKHYILEGTETEDAIGPAYEVFPKSVGQYIGLKDKNGNKIFEDDIVEWVDGYGRRKKAKIAYNPTNGCFCVSGNGIGSQLISSLMLEHFTVASNIFDNPELMKEVLPDESHTNQQTID